MPHDTIQPHQFHKSEDVCKHQCLPSLKYSALESQATVTNGDYGWQSGKQVSHQSLRDCGQKPEVWSKVDTTYGIPTGHKQESRDLFSVMLWTGLSSLEADQCFGVWWLGNGYTGSSVQDIFIVPFIDEGLPGTDRLQQDFKAQSPATVSSRRASSSFSFRFMWTWSTKR